MDFGHVTVSPGDAVVGGHSAAKQNHLAGTNQGTSCHTSLLPLQPFPCFKVQSSDSAANAHCSAHHSLGNTARPAKAGQLRDRDQHLLMGWMQPWASCPTSLAVAGAFEKPKLARFARTRVPKCKKPTEVPASPTTLVLRVQHF